MKGGDYMSFGTGVGMPDSMGFILRHPRKLTIAAAVMFAATAIYAFA